MQIYLFYFLLLYKIITCESIIEEGSFYYNNLSNILQFQNISNESNYIYIQIFLCNDSTKTNFTLINGNNTFNATLNKDSNEFIYKINNNANVTLKFAQSISFYIRYKFNTSKIEKINLTLKDELYSEEFLIFKINISSNYFNNNISYNLYYFNNELSNICEIINHTSNNIALNGTYKIRDNLHKVIFENKLDKSNEKYFFIKVYDEKKNFIYFLHPEKLTKINHNIFILIILLTWLFLFLCNCIILNKKFLSYSITNDIESDSMDSSYSSVN